MGATSMTRRMLLATACVIQPVVAHAQTNDIVVMRRVIAPPSKTAPTETAVARWVPGDWTFDAGSPTCSDAAAQTQASVCQIIGVTVPDERCSGTRPISR